MVSPRATTRAMVLYTVYDSSHKWEQRKIQFSKHRNYWLITLQSVYTEQKIPLMVSVINLKHRAHMVLVLLVDVDCCTQSLTESFNEWKIYPPCQRTVVVCVGLCCVWVLWQATLLSPQVICVYKVYIVATLVGTVGPRSESAVRSVTRSCSSCYPSLVWQAVVSSWNAAHLYNGTHRASKEPLVRVVGWPIPRTKGPLDAA